MLINGILGIVHLGALIYFSLKYLRFDVKTNQKQFDSFLETNNPTISETLKQISEVEAKLVEAGNVPPFDRFVFVLLDAWRWNFLFNPETEMKFLKEKLVNGEGIGLISLARVPTVTKPCLKSIFTGILPVFFELVENIDESGVTSGSSVSTASDNLLHRLYRNGKKISVYGDDVWIKLFPENVFHRKNVSFGFDIMDYTSVDNMVHEGMDSEMQTNDSDVIILHYLGLDHIGHSFSAKAQYVNPKLQEMDKKVSQIFDWITRTDAERGTKTLMLVMGDHGMTMDGNHGGGSKDESQAAAVFLSPHFITTNHSSPLKTSDWNSIISAVESDPHNQEDIASTLTALLDNSGLGPLKFGHGTLIQSVIKASLDGNTERKVALQNLRHLIKLSKPFEVEKIWSAASIGTRNINFNLEEIYHISLQLKLLLNKGNFTFDDTKLTISLLILAAIVIVSIYLFLKPKILKIYHLSPSCSSSSSSSLNSIMNVVTLSCFVALITISLCQISTSFIAEEHVLWYSITALIFLIWAAKCNVFFFNYSQCSKAFGILCIHTLLCNWNPIGTLWIDRPTMSTFIRSNDLFERINVITGLSIILLLAFSRIRRRVKNQNLFSNLSQVITCICIFIHKSNLLDGFVQKHTIALSTMGVLTMGSVGGKCAANFDISASLFFILLNRPVNTTPISLIVLLSDLLKSLEENTGRTIPSFLQICFMQSSYYWLGLWNSISAVDLTNGATFSKSFDMTLSPFVLFCYCLSGPALMLISYNTNTNNNNSSSSSNNNYYTKSITTNNNINNTTNNNININVISETLLFRSILDFFACYFAFIHRFHPWNFDFFSPKILFQVFWGFFYIFLTSLIRVISFKIQINQKLK